MFFLPIITYIRIHTYFYLFSGNILSWMGQSSTVWF